MLFVCWHVLIEKVIVLEVGKLVKDRLKQADLM